MPGRAAKRVKTQDTLPDVDGLLDRSESAQLNHVASQMDETKAAQLTRGDLLGKQDQTLITLRITEQLGDKEDLSEAVTHKTLLCHFSEYFKNALDGGFSESRKRTFDVDLSSRTLAIFVSWLYTGCLSHIQRREHSSEIQGYDPTCKSFHKNVLFSGPDGGPDDAPEVTAALSAFEKLPENSGLCKLFSIFIIRGWRKYMDPMSAQLVVPQELLRQLPVTILLEGVSYHAATLLASSSRFSRPPRKIDIAVIPGGEYGKCTNRGQGNDGKLDEERYAFHEHVTTAEEEECDARWKAPAQLYWLLSD
ncbi:hypothetical protein NA57DRAFT_81389 [Rhizodiscina lignyota]|uniref:BTB domain-containing protein n=1 Tax=Rhizodiscina lignyota TaxID=1504668 RepID=A0A9P4M3N7_9PEZI|nr:hypothetical protein NA57DRAFT_81389 [Rhizodiscina lignyota]